MKTKLSIWMLACGLTLHAQYGALDDTFGNKGVTLLPGTTEIYITDFDTGGNIVCLGYTSGNSDGSGSHITLTKMDADGKPDHNFGTDGVVRTQSTYATYPTALAIQPDNKILVTGITADDRFSRGEMFVIRYNPDGTTDTSFGDGGIANFANLISAQKSIAVLSDGSLLLGGQLLPNYSSVIIKTDANGTIDTSFGLNGVVYLSNDSYNFYIRQFIMLSDYTLLCVGDDSKRLACCKIDLNGNKVPAFGNGGTWVLDPFKNKGGLLDWALVRSAVEQPDGKLLLTGWASGNFMCRLHENGTLDTSFGNDGFTFLRQVESYHDMNPFSDIVPLADGRILTGGVGHISDNDRAYMFYRFDSNGRKDDLFGTNGLVIINPSAGRDIFQCLKAQGSNKLIAAGSGDWYGSFCFVVARIDIEKLNDSGATNIQENQIAYPNPFNDVIHTGGSGASIHSVAAFDMSGKKVNAQLREDGSVYMDAPSGHYLLRIETTTGKTVSYKVIKK